MDSKFNPYYEEKFIYLNQLLEKLKKENVHIGNENVKMEEELNSLEKEIEIKYDEISSMIKSIKSQ